MSRTQYGISMTQGVDKVHDPRSFCYCDTLVRERCANCLEADRKLDFLTPEEDIEQLCNPDPVDEELERHIYGDLEL